MSLGNGLWSRFGLILPLIAAVGVLSGCIHKGVAQGSGASRMMLYGGFQPRTYLGCLSCSAFASDSVLNKRGRYGSSDRSSSIFNRLGAYGSTDSVLSACNRYASHPPVIVDANGNFYGRLTINSHHPEATQSSRWRAWINQVCSSD